LTGYPSNVPIRNLAVANPVLKEESEEDINAYYYVLGITSGYVVFFLLVGDFSVDNLGIGSGKVLTFGG
jgi:hypothetical protein